jgi:hypothetical protein
MFPEVADSIEIEQSIALKIEIDVQNMMRDYINNYVSDVPLSEEWVKFKGDSKFYIDTKYSYFLLGIRFMSSPSRWNEYYIDASQEFKYSSYQYIKSKDQIRHFLPDRHPAFDSDGNPTDHMYNWVNELILKAMGSYYD